MYWVPLGLPLELHCQVIEPPDLDEGLKSVTALSLRITEIVVRADATPVASVALAAIVKVPVPEWTEAAFESDQLVCPEAFRKTWPET